MREINWSAEPNLAALRKAHAQLTTDPERAMKNLEDLAAQGSRMSMWYLAHALSAAPGIPHDLVRARHWYQQAAKDGDIEALHRVGRVSLDLEDWDAAFEALSDASARDYFPSLYWLGTMYRDGRRVPKDMDRAKSLIERAASLGHLLAKRNLALMYVRGEFGAGKIPHGVLLFISLVKDLILLKWKSMSEIEDRVA